MVDGHPRSFDAMIRHEGTGRAQILSANHRGKAAKDRGLEPRSFSGVFAKVAIAPWISGNPPELKFRF
jgi:hypothetical protein